MQSSKLIIAGCIKSSWDGKVVCNFRHYVGATETQINWVKTSLFRRLNLHDIRCTKVTCKNVLQTTEASHLIYTLMASVLYASSLPLAAHGLLMTYKEEHTYSTTRQYFTQASASILTFARKVFINWSGTYFNYVIAITLAVHCSISSKRNCEKLNWKENALLLLNIAFWFSIITGITCMC